MKISNVVPKGRLKERGSLVVASLFFIVSLMINLLPFLDEKTDLMDFGSFYASGVKASRSENPYDPNSEYIFEINFSRIGAGGKMVNLNPPISVILFEWIARFDPYRALAAWQIASAILYALSIFLLVGIYRQNLSPAKFIWAFTLAGFWHTLVLGQVYSLLLFFTVLSWFFIKRKRYILAGIMIGVLISIKPNFAIWSLFLLVSGYYTTCIASILSGLVIGLLPVIFYGTKVYAQWLEASSLQQATLIMPGNNSILGLTARFQNIELGLVLSGILVLGLLILLKRQTSNSVDQFEQASTLGLLASILASPISWTGYTILLLPVFFSLKKWSLPITLSAAILSIPFAIVLQLHQTSFANFVIFGWLYGWSILLILAASVLPRQPGRAADIQMDGSSPT